MLVDKTTIHPMRSFWQSSNPVMTVDLRVRALVVHYKVAMKGVQGNQTSGAEDADSLAAFRLKIPFLQLSRIWESTDPFTKEQSILIILDSPAVHHRQVKNFGITFHNEESWREADTWYRQTSVSRNPAIHNSAPTNLRSPGQIIDIGELQTVDLRMFYKVGC